MCFSYLSWQSAWKITTDRTIISIVFTVSGCQKMALSGDQTGPLRLHPGHWLLERRSVSNIRNVKKTTRKSGERQDGAVHEGLEGDKAWAVHRDPSQGSALCWGKLSHSLRSSDRQSSCLRRQKCLAPNTKLCQQPGGNCQNSLPFMLFIFFSRSLQKFNWTHLHTECTEMFSSHQNNEVWSSSGQHH